MTNQLKDIVKKVDRMQGEINFLQENVGGPLGGGMSPPMIKYPTIESSIGFRLNSKVCFGYKLNPDGDNPAEVLIYSGETQHGVRAIIDVVDTKIVITADLQYVWVECILGSGTAIITGPSTSRPVSTAADSTFRQWLYLFGLSGGVASISRIGNFGNIVIPGAFA